jgi:hypothetical protein
MSRVRGSPGRVSKARLVRPPPPTRHGRRSLTGGRKDARKRLERQRGRLTFLQRLFGGEGCGASPWPIGEGRVADVPTL